jgi:phosphoribosylanthranilate isomerase
MRAALDAGADYVGLVFFPKSPRNVTMGAAGELAVMARGRAVSVALLVDPDDALVDAAAAAGPDMIQLHGDESPERAAAIRVRSGRGIIKAVKVGGADDARAASAYLGAADIILFDAMPPRTAGALPGGNGAAFDWRALAEAGPPPDGFILSGGLNPGNVREAIAMTGARAVDVSSGVERAPGEKDEDLIRRFIQAAKSGP